jgi:hypothetical protein
MCAKINSHLLVSFNSLLRRKIFHGITSSKSPIQKQRLREYPNTPVPGCQNSVKSLIQKQRHTGAPKHTCTGLSEFCEVVDSETATPPEYPDTPVPGCQNSAKSLIQKQRHTGVPNHPRTWLSEFCFTVDSVRPTRRSTQTHPYWAVRNL